LNRRQEASKLLFSPAAELIMEDIGVWGLNLFTLETVAGGRPLVALGLRIVDHLQLTNRLRLDPLVLAKFFSAVEDGYGRCVRPLRVA
jgi:hypothetical protein